MGKKKKDKKNKRVSKEELEELRNQLARAFADYDNLTKRFEKQREDFKKTANLELVASILPALDMLEDAQEHLKDSGLSITIKEFEDALKMQGIEKIKASPGTRFDESVHEAVEVTKDETKKGGEITEQVLTGWTFVGGPVIRPAKVVVNRKEK
jgi:molecular chaperone GrpE